MAGRGFTLLGDHRRGHRRAHRRALHAALMARRGFTLLEMLVALAVFAVIGVMAGRILSGMVDMSEFTYQRGDTLAQAQRAFSVIERDVLQLAGRGVRDEFGASAPALAVGRATLAEFTRAGWRNPLGEPRAKLQRVAYALREDTLLRLFWPVLDRADDARPRVQTLLTGVVEATFVVRDSAGGEHAYWPSKSGDGEGDRDAQPAALELRLRLDDHRQLKRLWLTPTAMEFVPSDPAQAPDDAPEAPA